MPAVQGVKPQQLVDAFAVLLQRATGFTDRQIVLWCFPGRPQIEGYNQMVWFRPGGEEIDPSSGPVRYGNKFTPTFEVSLVSRNMLDGSQRDSRKLPPHYVYRWQIVEAFQNQNLFARYVPISDPPPATWAVPTPTAGLAPLTVGTMLIGGPQAELKDQFEEGTITTPFRVTVPAVLALSL